MTAGEHTEEWYEDRGELVRFGLALYTGNVLETPKDAFYFMEKPWKWNDEHKAWCAAGRPDTYEGPGDGES